MDQKKSSVTMITTGGASLDPKAVEQARDILHQLANTVSAMKIFPSDHATVKGFIDDLNLKFCSFLDACGKLEVWVSEYSFLCGGRPVYTDEMTIKSLPFFFFKDGMQLLYFYQGLNREEIVDFLELLKSESQKPAGDSDIVTALWERDFSNIQYYAPDDYLENRIIEERTESQTRAGVPVMPEFAHEVIEIKVDTSKFASGKIELTPEDKMQVAGYTETVEPEGTEQALIASPGQTQAESPGESRRSPAAVMDPTLTESEIQGLEALVRANRTISPDEEFLNLMVEIINIEKKSETVDDDLNVLMDFHHEQLQQGNFAFSIPLVHKLRELKDHLASTDPQKSALLDASLKKIVGVKTLDSLRDLIEKKKTADWNALVDFFKLLGDPALPLAADIYESISDEVAREKMLDFMKAVNAQEPGGLARLAADERPLLSKAIIGLLGQAYGKKGLPHFSAFVGFNNKDIKLEAIQALGQINDEMANRILLGFLNDKDEDLRIQAAMKLNPVEEKSRIEHIVLEAASRPFMDKSLKEKQAILSFLGRTRSEEALAFLRKTILKRGLWLTARTKEMKLAAVSGLESMGTDDAVKALEKGASIGPRAVREACSQALARLARKKAGQG
jgi:HEAT repeat protein